MVRSLTRIVTLELAKVQRRLRDHGLELELDDAARDFLLEKGTDEKFGARPLRRAIEQLVEDPLSENILRGMYKGKNRLLGTVVQEEGEKKLRYEAVDTPKPGPTEPALAQAGTGEGT